MGNSPSVQIISYGFSKEACLSHLKALLDYEYNADLYVEKDRYFILANKERHYVDLFVNQRGTWKAVIEL